MIPTPNLQDPLMFLGPSNDRTNDIVSLAEFWSAYEWPCLPSKAKANAAQESAEKEKSK